MVLSYIARCIYTKRKNGGNRLGKRNLERERRAEREGKERKILAKEMAVEWREIWRGEERKTCGKERKDTCKEK